MLYSATFLKAKTLWHDEDGNARILFFAGNDIEAYRFASTAAMIMNKGFTKINEPREITIYALQQVHRVGQFATKHILVTYVQTASLNFARWRDLRDVYRALFPAVTGGGNRICALSGFYEYKPIAKFPLFKKNISN